MSRTSKPLVNIFIDFMMMGGASIILIFLLKVSGVEIFNSSVLAANIIFVLGLLLNIPHFATSYQLFYLDNRAKIFSLLSWFAVGVALPLILIISLGVFYALFSLKDIGYVIALMIYLFGWHYTRQAYQFILIYAERSNYLFAKYQKISLKIIFMCIWFLSLTGTVASKGWYTFFSIEYLFYVFPSSCRIYAVSLMVLMGLVFLVSTIQRYRKDKFLPHWMCAVPLLSVCIWLCPNYIGTVIFMLIPIFHALQYLLFAYAYKFAKSKAEHGAILGVKKVLIYFLMALFSGVLAMEVIPRVLDMTITYKQVDLTLFVALFAVFINLHHYFLDFIVWKNVAEEVSGQ